MWFLSTSVFHFIILNFTNIYIKSPIIIKNWSFSKTEQSDLVRDYPKRKKTPYLVPFFIGAGNGNRTRIKSLGSSHSTIELYPHG